MIKKTMPTLVGILAILFAGAELSRIFDFYTVCMMLVLGMGAYLLIGE